MPIARRLAIPLHRAVQGSEPVLVEGARGSGKSTFVRQELPGRLHVDLNDASDRALARRDPAQFLARLRRPAVIDELQRAPELVRQLQHDPSGLPIVFVTDMRLPLRLPTLRLHSPTQAERLGRPPMPLEMLGRFVPATPDAPSRLQPEATKLPRTRDFLYRDVPQLVKLDDADTFERFLDRVENRSGELLRQQAMADELGVSHRTVVRWLEVLDACFLTLRLEPLDLAFGRRLVRGPKLHLLGSASSFETEVVSEIYANAHHAGLEPVLHFWRDSNGLEIPLVVQLEPGAAMVPVGIARVPSPADDAGLQRWMRLAGVSQAAMIGRAPALIERKSTGVLRYGFGQL